jgi:polyhydroxybutyrate depolymerase
MKRFATLFVFLCGCTASITTVTNDDGGGSPPVGADGGTDAPSAPPLVEARPYQLKVPSGYDASKATPLVILLHGYGASGLFQNGYFGLSAAADAKGFLLAYPDGTQDKSGKRFWNATDACCNFDKKDVDDVAYIGQIIDDVSARYNVDPKRVYLIGHSNGSFMSHRAACELSPRIAAIAGLAGAMWKDASKCKPASPVAVLQVHGDNDTTIQYGGGAISGNAYPSAKETVAAWAAINGCTGDLAPKDPVDLETRVAGAETKVEKYDGCKAAVELWTIRGGGHIPSVAASFGETLYGFLAANPKP